MLRLFGEKSWVVPEPFLSYYLILTSVVCYQLEGDVKEPTLLFEKSRGRRPWWCGLSLMGRGDCHGPAVIGFTLLR